MPLQVFSAVAGFDDPDALVLSRKHVKKSELDGYPGGHRGIAAYFTPSAALQNARWRRCRFNLEHEHPEEWEQYVEGYIREMRASYKQQPVAWTTLLSWERVVLVCSGPSPERSVRLVLARDVLTKLGATYGGELG
jgi:uncharacterized protein YeaO (DUF488 family)